MEALRITRLLCYKRFIYHLNTVNDGNLNNISNSDGWFELPDFPAISSKLDFFAYQNFISPSEFQVTQIKLHTKRTVLVANALEICLIQAALSLSDF